MHRKLFLRTLKKAACFSLALGFVLGGLSDVQAKEPVTGFQRDLPPSIRFMAGSGRLALALYDSSEKDFQAVASIQAYFSKALEDMGFEVRYHDVQKGLPPESVSSKTRLFLTWFRDSKMKDAEKYCRWLRAQMLEGRKVIIVDNFGAYQNSKTQSWLDGALVNEVFGLLGVAYKSSWTSDTSKISIDHVDKEVVGTVRPAEPAGHYYLFEKKDPSVVDYLRLSRLDLERSASSVIFSSKGGGMMLSHYFLQKDPADGLLKINIDVDRFLKNCLMTENSKNQRVLVVWAEGKQTAQKDRKILRNLCWSLWYAKIDFDLAGAADLREFSLPDLQRYSAIVTYFGDVLTVDEPVVLKTLTLYVRSGGGLVFTKRWMSPPFYGLFGIESASKEPDLLARGLRLEGSWMPSSVDLLYEEDQIATAAHAVRLHADAKVLGRALSKSENDPGGIVTAWLYPYGRGRVIYWNADYFSLISMRGILLYSVLMSQPVAAYSVANIQSIQIDDSPQPMYNTVKEPARSPDHPTDTEFYMNVWWKGIQELSKKYGLHYTFFTVFNYDAKREPPFDGREFFVGKNGASEELARRVLENNYELALHGYNHQPLVMRSKRWPNWKSERSMEQSLEAARGLWERLFPDIEEVFSYAAPMNTIDPEGKAALRSVFPEVRVLCTILDDLEKEGATMLEFGPDPDEPLLFNMPRQTAGYAFLPHVRNRIMNSLAVFGVWSHFIHPDDVFGRYGEDQGAALSPEDWTWEDVLSSFDSMLSFVRERYPWLRDMTVREAYYELERYFADPRRTEVEKDSVSIRSSSGGDSNRYFFVKINDGSRVGSLEHCRLVHAYSESGLYLFETQWNFAKVHLVR